MIEEGIDEALFDRLVISLPAPWIDHVDRDFAGDANHLLDGAVEQFNDALVACGLFRPVDTDELKRGFSSDDRKGEWEGRLRGMYARAFVYSLAAARAFVAVLSKDSRIEPAAKSRCEAFLDRFDYIREIRNSLQHVEERYQGIGSSRKKLTLVVLGSLNGRRFGVTTGDGPHKEVEISEQFLEVVRSVLLEIVWSFEWIGVGKVRVRRQDGAPSNRRT